MRVINRWLFATIIVATTGVSCQFAAASFDGDTDGDILISRADGLLTWIEHSGGGLTGVFTGNNQGAGTIQEIDIADIDGDGNGDIVAARNNGFVNWIKRNGNSLSGAASFNVSPNHSIATGDFDGDANGDMAVIRDDGQVNWLEHSGGNLTSNYQTNVGGSNPLAMAVGDLDGDENGDIVVNQPAGLLVWQERNGNAISGVFTGFNVSPAVALEIGNLDNDANGDIVVGRADGRVTLVERSGDSLTSQDSNNNYNVGSIADLALADVNGDGEDEVILAQSANGGSVMILDNPGAGFTRISNMHQAVGNDHSITALDVGDLDGDEFLDIVIGRSDGWMHWMEVSNNGTTIGGVQNYNIGSAIVDLRIASAIPEPASIALLLASGLVGLLGIRRRS